jgi:hypothetical protein
VDIVPYKDKEKERQNQKKRGKRYREKHRERRKARSRELYALNIKKRRRKARERYWRNRKKELERQKKYRMRPEVKERRRLYDLKTKKQYYINNREKILKKKVIYAKRPEEITRKKNYNKIYRAANFEKIQQWNTTYIRKRYKTDLNYKLLKVLRGRMNMALGHNWKAARTAELLGASIPEVWNHLEKQFQPGMTRKNHGLWHVDHIKPCKFFDLSDPEQQKKCFHYANLQPLWASDNISKGAKIVSRDITSLKT